MEKTESSARPRSFSLKRIIPTGVPCLVIVLALFWYVGSIMGLPNMLNTIMHTAHDLLLNTVFYLMGICVVTGAIGRLFVEFGVVKLLENILRPLMRPLFNLPGVAALGATMTFLSDNPAIISLSQDRRFCRYFKKFQYISLTNFGTAFGMGLLVMVFMVGQGYYIEPVIGLFGAFCGCIVSTRLMQYFVIKAYPNFAVEDAVVKDADKIEEEETKVETKSVFIRTLNSLLDGGRTGVDVGIAIIPGVLIISTLVMILTFGASETATQEPPTRASSCSPGSHQRSTSSLNGSSASTTRTSWLSRSPPSEPSARPSASCPSSPRRDGSTATPSPCSPPSACAGAATSAPTPPCSTRSATAS